MYAIIADQKYGKSCARILRKIQEGDIEAWASLLLLLEVSRALQKIGMKRTKILETIRAILSLPIRFVPIDEKILMKSLEFFKAYGISPYDCVHVATAAFAGIRFLVSADKGFDKINEVSRVDPLDFSA